MSTTEAKTPAARHDGEAAASKRGENREATLETLSDRVRSLRLPPQVVAAPSASSRAAWVLCALLAGATAVLGYMVYQLRATGAASGSTAELAAMTSDDLPQAATGSLEAKGYIVPARQILVSPEVSGTIVKLNIEEGSRVAKGDMLALIEDTDYRADVKRADAMLALAEQALAELVPRPEEVKKAEAELEEAKAQLKYVDAVARRSADLLQKDVISRETYDETESNRQAMEQRVLRLTHAIRLLNPREERILMAKSDVERAKAELEKARWRLDNCTIRAPIAGTILKKNAEEGNLVNPIAMNGSFSLCEMADLSDLEVELSIQERDIAQITTGQHCQARAEAYPHRVYDGFVSRLMPIADRAKGAISVRVKLSVPRDEEGVFLKPEMGAMVTFLSNGAAPGERPTAPARPVSNSSSRKEVTVSADRG